MSASQSPASQPRLAQNFAIINAIQKIVMTMFDMFMLVLGPCLICVVFAIVTGELYVFFKYLLPMHTTFLRCVRAARLPAIQTAERGLR